MVRFAPAVVKNPPDWEATTPLPTTHTSRDIQPPRTSVVGGNVGVR
ncbi:hypothetical protein HSB1_06890 [Halogranum salarium B-1]|uniref:Uncharacterized protein n=1 Tax=Halogranum salarium B-1 TaxID=1210908 RepID=J3JGG7_9EURY|nr:hypothetical protein HSB1_06890 [Halogranum salarium B-1]